MSEIKSFHSEITTAIPILKDKLVPIANRSNIDSSKLLTELIKYLIITNESKETTSSSYLVDLVWHEFILFTQYYHRFCTEKFGKFIHHTPSSKANKDNFSLTLERYKTRYGLPPENIWTNNMVLNRDVVNCGSCNN
jgi:hypothetical protein